MNNHNYNYFEKKSQFCESFLVNKTPSGAPAGSAGTPRRTTPATPPATIPAPPRRPKAKPGTSAAAVRRAEGDSAARSLITTPPAKKTPKKAAKKTAKQSAYPAYVYKIKESKYRNLAMAAIDIGKQHGHGPKSQIVGLFVQLAMILSKVSGIMERLPGGYKKSLDKGDLEKEKLTALQKQKLLERLRLKKVQTDFVTFFAMQEKIDKPRTKKLTPAQNSTLFVSYMLFGVKKESDKTPVGHITEHKILAARLHHDHKLYKGATLKGLKNLQTIPPNTVIFFANKSTKDVTAAIATGDDHEFRYYESGKNTDTFKLTDPSNPAGSFLMAAYVPSQYSVQPPPPATAKPGTKPAGSTPAAPKETLPKGLNPDQLILTITKDITGLEKKFAPLKGKPELLTEILSNFDKMKKILENIELGAKIRRLNPEMYKKIKTKYKALVPRFNALEAMMEKELKKRIDEAKKFVPQEAALKKQLTKAEAAKNKILIGQIKLKLALITMHKTGGPEMTKFYALLKDYIKRGKACLPKTPGA